MAMNNSLAEVHPELITEWSEKNLPLTPDDITFGSNKKVWWKGACGHEWQTSVCGNVTIYGGKVSKSIFLFALVMILLVYVLKRLKRGNIFAERQQ